MKRLIRDYAELPLGESVGLLCDGLDVPGAVDGVDVDDDDGDEPPIELEPVVPKLLVLDGVLPKVLVLL